MKRIRIELDGCGETEWETAIPSRRNRLPENGDEEMKSNEVAFFSVGSRGGGKPSSEVVTAVA